MQSGTIQITLFRLKDGSHLLRLSERFGCCMNSIRSSTRSSDLTAIIEVCTNPKSERCWCLLPDRRHPRRPADALRPLRRGVGMTTL